MSALDRKQYINVNNRMSAFAGKQTLRTINSNVRLILKADVQVKVMIGSLPLLTIKCYKGHTMARKLTTEEFIERAKAIHKDTYDYSLSSYKNIFAKIKIICPEHGVFEQIPKHHLNGSRCPACAGVKKITTKEFIERSEKIHDGRYYYSRVKYKTSKDNITIICSVHGEFKQIAGHHLRGHGCRYCRDDYRRKTTDCYISDAKIVHGNKYDYSLVRYKNSATKVKIICPEHGLFEQTPASHLLGHCCFKCTGSERKTIEIFIKQAKITHGDFYDYSLVEYTNNTAKIKIICPEHGEFEQAPRSHLSGYGCIRCGDIRSGAFRRKSKGWFIIKARAIHGDFYDYSLVDYKNFRSKVKIICPEHGKFMQPPENHLKGYRCQKCADRTKNTTIFIEDAKIIHGNKYDYSFVDYKNSQSKVKIICLEHGVFEQSPSKHLNGRGCNLCGRERTKNSLLKYKSKEQFIQEARLVHSDRYDYSLLEFTGHNRSGKIICPKHGVFSTKLSKHLDGSGCHVCFNKKRRTTEQFIKLARERHGNYYDYSLVEYETAHIKVIIICPEHGVFEQIARDHLEGKPICCTKAGFKKDQPATLYYLRVVTGEGIRVYKIGITNRSVIKRFNAFDLEKITIVDFVEFENGADAYALEQIYLSDFKKFAYKGPPVLSSGNTELFTKDILNLDKALH